LQAIFKYCPYHIYAIIRNETSVKFIAKSQ
jgi:hypothetical protein